MTAAANPPPVVVTDVKETPSRPWIRPLVATFINDERDTELLFVILLGLCTIVPAGLAVIFAPTGWWTWTLVAPAYWALLFGTYLDRYILMLHNVVHRPLFKAQWRWCRHVVTWVIGPFCGETPETYFGHHIGMHHPENNLRDDLSSTMKYQRDSLVDWLRYFFRFFILGMPELCLYLVRKRRAKFARHAVIGEGLWVATMGLTFHFRPAAAVIVFLVPLVLVRILMMAGNWGQHAFVDRKRPSNCWVNSLTCINSRYNRRAFNDGYHIGHHLKANRHWLDLPREFEENIPKYFEEGAIVLRDTDFFIVWLMLMLKNYDWLADHFVELGPVQRSKEEIIALLKERVARIPETEDAPDTGAVAAGA
jgi:hypothetical protein